MLSMWNCVAMCHSSVVEIGSEARQHGGFATISGVKGGTLMMLPGCCGQLVKGSSQGPWPWGGTSEGEHHDDLGGSARFRGASFVGRRGSHVVKKSVETGAVSNFPWG